MDLPKITDPKFNKNISKKMRKYKINKERYSLNKLCKNKSFKLQISQRFVADFISPKTKYKGLLIYHGIGSGKTCASINILEQWKKKKKILVVLPASLISSYYEQLRSQCTKNEYISNKERSLLEKYDPRDEEYQEIITKVNKKINKYYTILSYNKFVTAIDKRKIKLTNHIIVIDEIQNIISETGKYYKKISKFILKSPSNTRIVLLSATPIFNKPYEIALTLNLLKIPRPFPKSIEFNKMFLTMKKNKSGICKYTAKNLIEFKKLIKGYISFYAGAPLVAFPNTIIKYVRCEMSEYQFKSYETVASQEGPFRTGDILKMPTDFYMGSRILSNVAFPKRLIGEEGYDELSDKHMMLQYLKKYSCKFYKILKTIKKSEGPVFIYSNFKEYGGLKTLIKILEFHNYKNFIEEGCGKKRFAVWSSDLSNNKKDIIKCIFNKPENEDGSKIQIILGSPSIKEGVSLLRVRQVHILEPYWNFARLKQIIGRAVRFCSHKDLPRDERLVEIYIYIASHPDVDMSIDKYILSLAREKESIISEFENAIKESAVDCRLFYNANIKYQDYKMVCD